MAIQWLQIFKIFYRLPEFSPLFKDFSLYGQKFLSPPQKYPDFRQVTHSCFNSTFIMVWQ